MVIRSHGGVRLQWRSVNICLTWACRTGGSARPIKPSSVFKQVPQVIHRYVNIFKVRVYGIVSESRKRYLNVVSLTLQYLCSQNHNLEHVFSSNALGISECKASMPGIAQNRHHLVEGTGRVTPMSEPMLLFCLQLSSL